MKQPVLMPALSDTMTSGRLLRWLKQPGDPVKRGDALAEVETDKAVMDVEAFDDGFLGGPLASVDTDIAVGTPIAYLTDRPANPTAESVGEVMAATPPSVQAAAVSSSPSKSKHDDNTSREVADSPAPLTAPVRKPPKDGRHVPASPYARALAADLGLDLAQVKPGADDTIRVADVLAATRRLPQPDLEAGPPYRMEPLSPMYRTVADNMAATLGTPTFSVAARISLVPLKAIADEGKSSLTLLLARAAALTVKQFPQFNSCYTPAGMARRERVDVGIAVDVEGGLITPVLRDAADRPLAELAEDWRILRDKVKRRRVVPKDYQGASFYLSNLGSFPVVDSFEAIVPLGVAAILAIGAEHERGATFTITCDHRVVFGADAARFLDGLATRLGALDSWAH